MRIPTAILSSFISRIIISVLVSPCSVMRRIIGVPTEGSVGTGVCSKINVVQDMSCVSWDRSLRPDGLQLNCLLDHGFRRVVQCWYSHRHVALGLSRVSRPGGQRYWWRRTYGVQLDHVHAVDRDGDVTRTCQGQTCTVGCHGEEALKEKVFSISLTILLIWNSLKTNEKFKWSYIILIN